MQARKKNKTVERNGTLVFQTIVSVVLTMLAQSDHARLFHASEWFVRVDICHLSLGFVNFFCKKILTRFFPSQIETLN